jgi:hypothetical protein
MVAKYLSIAIEALKAITIVLEAILEMVEDWPLNLQTRMGNGQKKGGGL